MIIPDMWCGLDLVILLTIRRIQYFSKQVAVASLGVRSRSTKQDGQSNSQTDNRSTEKVITEAPHIVIANGMLGGEGQLPNTLLRKPLFSELDYSTQYFMGSGHRMS